MKEYKSYPVRIKVVSQKGYCAMGHKVGDEWHYAFEPGKPKTPDICESALYTMFNHFRMLWFDARPPWPMRDPDVFVVSCADAQNPVHFELRRLRDQPVYFSFPDDIEWTESTQNGE